jgi:hypothetical protein
LNKVPKVNNIGSKHRSIVKQLPYKVMKLQTHKKQMLQEETLYDNYNIKKEWNEKNVMSLKNGELEIV